MMNAVSSSTATVLKTEVPLRQSTTGRLVSIDILRGLVMVLMALDHTRDFFTFTRSAPEDVAHTTVALFFTRVITHFCAPVFAFLAGTGAFLSTKRGRSKKAVSLFFLTRGLWLVLLELTVIDFAWGFSPWVHAGVIWGLGWSMVAVALIVWLPLRWVATLGLALIASHNLFDRINPASFGKLYRLWMFLHSPGPIPITDDFSFSMKWVLVPWVGVMALGYAFGKLLVRADRKKWILALGGIVVILFFVLRGLNLYGNGVAGLPFGYPRSAGPWVIQPQLELTAVSFFNTLKYPPSLDYLLMTLGPALLLLGVLDGAKGQRGVGGFGDRRPRAAACWIRPWAALHIRNVGFGCVALVFSLSMVHEIHKSAPELHLA